jgi:hypothetical protein
LNYILAVCAVIIPAKQGFSAEEKLSAFSPQGTGKYKQQYEQPRKNRHYRASDSLPDRLTAGLAVQQRVGILPQHGVGNDPGDRGDFAIAWQAIGEKGPRSTLRKENTNVQRPTSNFQRRSLGNFTLFSLTSMLEVGRWKFDVQFFFAFFD